MGMTHFLLVYDHVRGVLISREEFSDADDAGRRYAEVEREHFSGDIEVVLVGSDSIETVMRTHGNYFGRSSAIALFLGRETTLA